MSDPKFLTVNEVAERYRGEVSVGTRVKLVERVQDRFSDLYESRADSGGAPVAKWDQKNLVSCRASRTLAVTAEERP